MTGRPTTFTAEVAEQICGRLADGESLRSICRDDGMPDRSTVMGWVVRDEGGFHGQYARAREAQVEAWASELTDIADNGSNDWMERNDPDNPGWDANGEHLQRSRLRLDTRKWLASKILRNVYGDVVRQEHTGADGGPVQIEDKTKRVEAAEQEAAEMLTLLAKRNSGESVG